jgi:hypothetical protein
VLLHLSCHVQECFAAAVGCAKVRLAILGLVVVSVVGMGIGTGMNPDTVCRSLIENTR